MSFSIFLFCFALKSMATITEIIGEMTLKTIRIGLTGIEFIRKIVLKIAKNIPANANDNISRQTFFVTSFCPYEASLGMFISFS